MKQSKYKKYGKGWYGESHRHSLASQGIKTKIERRLFATGIPPKNKQRLLIQTRDEFERDMYQSWRFNENQKQSKKEQLQREITRLKEEKENKLSELRKIKKMSFKEFKSKNTYEDWVNKVRRGNKNDERYVIIENEDSKKVPKENNLSAKGEFMQKLKDWEKRQAIGFHNAELKHPIMTKMTEYESALIFGLANPTGGSIMALSSMLPEDYKSFTKAGKVKDGQIVNKVKAELIEPIAGSDISIIKREDGKPIEGYPSVVFRHEDKAKEWAKNHGYILASKGRISEHIRNGNIKIKFLPYQEYESLPEERERKQRGEMSYANTTISSNGIDISVRKGNSEKVSRKLLQHEKEEIAIYDALSKLGIDNAEDVAHTLTPTKINNREADKSFGDIGDPI